MKAIKVFFIKYYWIFALIGIALWILCIFGSLINQVKEFLFVLGDSLMVFVLVNGLLEEKFKEKFFEKVIEKEDEVIKSIITKEKEIMRSFDNVSETLLLKTGSVFEKLKADFEVEVSELSNQINKDIVFSFLQERTSPEIAEKIMENSYFKSDILKTKTTTTYNFSSETNKPEVVYLNQSELFEIKNISKVTQSYDMLLKLTSTDLKSYEFTAAGYYNNSEKNNYTPFEINSNNFCIKIEGNVTSYTLKENLLIRLEPGEVKTVNRELKATFKSSDDIEDYFFTIQYMTELSLKVDFSDGFEFNLYPTYPYKDLTTPKFHDSKKSYKLPFLFPGQGYSFVLKKIN